MSTRARTLPDFPLVGRRLRVAEPIGRLMVRRPGPRLRQAMADEETLFAWQKRALDTWPEQLALVTDDGAPAFMWANEEPPIFRDGDQTFYRPGQLEVAPTFIGSEVGLVGMQAIAARARHLGLDRLAIFCLNAYHSSRARPFYSKIGALPHRYETSVADSIPLWVPPEAVAMLAEGFERRLQDVD